MALITPNWFLDFFVVASLAIFIFYKYMTRDFDFWKKRDIPYLKPIPFFGNLLGMFTFKVYMGMHFKNLYEATTEPFVGIFALDIPAILIRSPELIKSILVKDFSNFYDRSVLSDEKVDSYTAKLLFFRKNPRWREERNQLTSVFTTGKLRGMIPLIERIGEDMKMYLEKNEGTVLNAKDLASKYSVDVTASCFFGINVHSFTSKTCEFQEAGRKFFEFGPKTSIQQMSFFFAQKLAKLFRMKMFDYKSFQFFNSIFEDTLKERERGNHRRNDFVDILLQMKKTQELDDVVMGHALQFFMAGFETTSSTISFALYELAVNQDIQEKLREEIQRCLKVHKGVIDYECVKDAKYLEQCVAETLRKYPVVPFLDRKCKSDYKIPGTHKIISSGTPIYIPLFGLHYDPDYFPNPEIFDPDRFSEDQSNIRPYTYLPFGTGPRNCIGERFGRINTKMALMYILSEFEVLKSDRTVIPLQFEAMSGPLAARNGIPLVFKKIKV